MKHYGSFRVSPSCNFGALLLNFSLVAHFINESKAEGPLCTTMYYIRRNLAFACLLALQKITQHYRHFFMRRLYSVIYQKAAL